MTKILVVDDEKDILDLTKIMLEGGGYEVLTESDGEMALQTIKENDVDLVLLDAVMPGMHGLDVCRALKRNPRTKVIPVIIFSALGTGVDMMLDDKDKADDYISKPFTRKMLLQKIEELLNANK